MSGAELGESRVVGKFRLQNILTRFLRQNRPAPPANGSAAPAVVSPGLSDATARTTAETTATRPGARTSRARPLSSCATTADVFRLRGSAIQKTIAATVRTRATFARKRPARISK